MTAPTLVSNTGQAQDGSHFRVGKDGTSTWRTAQLFTTGNHAAGYSLAAVQVKVSSDNTGGNRDETKLKVSIYTTSGSNPGSSRYVLTNPAITLDALNTFVAPANATLDANTTYAVFLESTSANHHIPMRHTTSDNEDSGAASGWSISNSSLSSENSGAWTAETASAFIAIKGSPLPTTYVANTGQTAASHDVSVGSTQGVTRIIAQPFTTGTRAGGYELHEVDIGLRATSGGTIDPTKIGARIYTTEPTSVAGVVNPDRSLYAFTNPSSFSANAANTFTAPAKATLDPSTTYAVVLESSSTSHTVELGNTDSDSEDSGAAAGWSIADKTRWSDNSGAWVENAVALLIGVKGLDWTGPVVSISGGSAVTEGGNATFTVTATLGSGSGYTRHSTTANRSASVTVGDNEPTAQTPEISISAGSAVTEGGGAVFTVTATPAPAANKTVNLTITQTGDFVAAGDLGAKTVTVTTSGSATYTVNTVNDLKDEANGAVTATLAAGTGYTLHATNTSGTVTVNDNDEATASTTLVSNTGQGLHSQSSTVGGSSNWRRALNFTTGSNSGGYTLSAVDVRLGAGTPSANTQVSIYTTTSSGSPNASLHVLTNPSSFTSDAVNTFTAPSNAELDASTTYAVVLEVVGSGSTSIRLTTSNGQDTGAADGWSIADRAYQRTGAVWVIVPSSNKPLIAIKGSEASPTQASNTGQTALGGSLVVGPSGGNQWRSAQLFTTGSNAAGYTLSAVALQLAATTGSGTDATKIKVSIRTTSSGNPDTKLYDLTNPASFTANAANTFSAPANAALDAGTTYAVVIESTSTSLRVSLRHTNSDAEDSGAASGWSIADTRLGSASGGAWSSSASTLMIGIKGMNWPGPVVSIAAGSALVNPGTAATFTVSASPVPAADLTVSLAISQTGNSVASTNLGAKTVTVPTTGSVIHSVPTVNAGSMTATLASGTGYTRHATTSNRSASVTVRDSGVIPPPPPDPTDQPGTGGTEPVKKTAPGAPRDLRAVSGDGQAVLSWSPPEDNGGAPITDYEYRIDSKGDWISIGSTETSYTVSGLENGAEYLFQVRAVNEIGAGRASRRVEATAGAVLDFPHFANGEGITSEVVLVNVGAMPVRPVLYFSDQQGEPIAADSVVDVTGDLMVAEDGSLTLHTVMEPWGELTIATHGRGELVSGSLRVASGVPIGGLVRYSVPMVGVTGVGAGLAVRDALFPTRRQEEGIRTAAALHNLGEEAIEVTCRLMRGGVALEEAAIPLEANGQTSWFIEEVFTMTDTTDFAGTVRCTAPGQGRFTGLAVEVDQANRIFTTLPVVEVDRTGGSDGETVLDFAHFANGTWVTDLVFVNPSIEPSGPPISPFHSAILPTRPSIYFYDTDGTLVPPAALVDLTGDLEVTEDGALTLRTGMEPLGVLTISTHGRGELATGSVRVVSEGPIGGMLRFAHPALGAAGVGAGLPVSDAIVPVRRREGGINTGIALHNLESSSSLLRCELLQAGVLRDSVSIPLAANGQTSWSIDQAFPETDTSDFLGSLRCSAPGGDLFTAVALEMDSSARTFTTLPVVPVPEMPSRE